jgi:hypothetical protein
VQCAEPGYLLFVREQTLVAQRFDAASLTLSGEPVPVGEGLGVDTVGLASFSVSDNGVLAYRAGDVQGRKVLWLDRTGKETPAIDAVGEYRDLSLSPDGKRLVFDATDNVGGSDLWMRDLVRGVTSRFTFDQAAEHWYRSGLRMDAASCSRRGRTGPATCSSKTHQAPGTRSPCSLARSSSS